VPRDAGAAIPAARGAGAALSPSPADNERSISRPTPGRPTLRTARRGPAAGRPAESSRRWPPRSRPITRAPISWRRSAAASRVTAPMRREVTPGPAPEPSLEVVHDGHARCPGNDMQGGPRLSTSVEQNRRTSKPPDISACSYP
jgi:hypothetical protein